MKIIEHIKNFNQQYFIISTLIGIIWGAFVIYDNWKDNNVKLKENMEKIINFHNEDSKIDSLLLIGQNDLRQDLEEHIKYANEYIKQLQTLQKSYVRYVSNDDRLTKTDFLKYMEGLTVEKQFIWPETKTTIRKIKE
jgi:predicted small secreted protein